MGALDYKIKDVAAGSFETLFLSKDYDLYTEARQTAQFNLEDLIRQYQSQAPTIEFHQELFISGAYSIPDYFNRFADVNCILQFVRNHPDLLQRFGEDALQNVSNDWNGHLHSTGSFEINTVCTRGVVC